MAYSYSYSKICLSDLDEALNYITVELKNPTAASNLMKDVLKAIDQITLFPFSSQDCTIYLQLNKNIRHILIKNFVLIYLVDKKANSIILLRFIYAGRNIADMNLICE